MISSDFSTKDNTFHVVLDNKVKLSGTFKVVVVKSIALCSVNIIAECNKHEPPADNDLIQVFNFITAKREIESRLSNFMLLRVSGSFPNHEIQK